MEGEQRAREQVVVEMQQLREELEDLKREKAELEIVLETTTAHADLIEALLQESNQKLRAEIAERQRAEIALKATQAELLSLLEALSSDKADLELLLETATAHGDIIGDWLQNLCSSDPLTGLYNRRYMEEFLARELHHNQRQPQPLAIIMIDIDHFKCFNDTFGHKAGDLLLRRVSQLLQSQNRNKDIACRYGGDELIMILPETSLETAQQRAEKLRRSVKQLKLKHLVPPLKGITISLGVAGFPKHGQSSPELIQAADEALYRAKVQGRDRLAIAKD